MRSASGAYNRRSPSHHAHGCNGVALRIFDSIDTVVNAARIRNPTPRASEARGCVSGPGRAPGSGAERSGDPDRGGGGAAGGAVRVEFYDAIGALLALGKPT